MYMTIKEVETLTGITKANIRFYEKEGLLAPGRSSNNYREYSEDDVEHLRKIRIFRIMGFSVAQILRLADQPQRAAVLMEARAGQIQKEVKELERVRQVCLEVRDSGWRFDTLDPQLLEMKLEWEKKGKDICLTSKAKQLLRLVPEDLRKPELTAQWEMRLSKIAKGEMKRDAFMEDIRT